MRRSFVFIEIVGLTLILEFFGDSYFALKEALWGFMRSDAILPAKEAVALGRRLAASSRGARSSDLRCMAFTEREEWELPA